MNTANEDKIEAYKEFGETSEEYIEAERDYYYKKAKVDLITTVVKEVKLAAKKA